MSYKKILLKKARGFTLIELLVVVAIIGILAGLLIPGLMSKTVEAKISKAKNNAQLVYNAAQQWLQTEIIDKIRCIQVVPIVKMTDPLLRLVSKMSLIKVTLFMVLGLLQ